MGKYDKLLKNYDLHCAQIEKATQVDIFETPAAKEKRIQHLEKNYQRWFEYYFGMYASAKCSWFHIKAAELIIRNKFIFLLLIWFRGAAKSVHVNMGIPLFLMTVKHDMNFMVLIGLNERKANRLLSDIQAQLVFNQKFIADYGKLFKHGDWSEGDFMTTTGVRFAALGFGQDPRGLREGANRPDYISIDDVDTKKRSRNERLTREAADYITKDIQGLFGSVRRRLIVANNLAFKNGLIATLKKIWQERIANALQSNKEVRHHIFQVNVVDKHGNPEWPERDTLESIEAEKAEFTSRGWESEKMNNPIEDGAMFKRDDLGYKSILPLDEYDALAIYGDLSYKDAGDSKAMKFWGKAGREYHLIDCFVRKTSRREAAVWLYDLYEDLNNRSNRLNITCKIEGLFAQDEFVNDFDEEGDVRKWWIDVVADKRPKEKKYDRIESTLGKYERHRVFYNIDKKESPDFLESEDQLFAFEKGSGANDDSPDADHGAFDLLDRKTFTEQFEPRISSTKNERSF